MQNKPWYRKPVSALLGAALLFVFLSAEACGPSDEDIARDQQQSQKSTGETLEKINLEKKRQREEDPNAISYVYKYTATGAFIGYWVAKGKVSSNGSQRTPEQDIHWTCKSTYGCQPVVVDGAQDDGSYGGEEPGVFFFTSDDVKVVIGDNDYIYSDKPITLPNIPRLYG